MSLITYSTPVIYVIAVIYIIVGAIYTLFGFKYFRIAVALAGFMLGYVITQGLVFRLTQDSLAANVAGIGVGLGLGIASWTFFLFGIFLLGAFSGVVLVQFLNNIGGKFLGNPLWIYVLVIVIVALIFGIISFKIQNFVIIAGTAAIGGGLVASGVNSFIHTSQNFILNIFSSNDFEARDPSFYILLALWILLAIIGSIYQFKMKNKWIKQIAAEEKELENVDQENASWQIKYRKLVNSCAPGASFRNPELTFGSSPPEVDKTGQAGQTEQTDINQEKI